MTFGGVYEYLPSDTGAVSVKVGGKLALECPEIPACRQCGKPMQFVLQFLWQDPRADAYHGALVFMCPGPPNAPIPCDPSNPALGANAVILIKQAKPVHPSGDEMCHPFKVKWVPEQEVSQDVWASDLLDSEIVQVERDIESFINKYSYTKMGGLPLWLDSPIAPKCTACGGRTVFAAQFGSALGFGRHGEYYTANFGKSGVAYLFLCANQCSVRSGAFLWQSP